MFPLDVLAYYLSKFSLIEGKVINAIIGKQIKFHVENFDMTNEISRAALEKELTKSGKFDQCEIKELMQFKQKY